MTGRADARNAIIYDRRMDLLVVDERGEVLGRSWLTLVVDARTRAIVGSTVDLRRESPAMT